MQGLKKISGRKPFYVGKPSLWIIRAALNKMQAHSEETVIVGDNLRTDILAGFRAGLETILLSGVSSLDDIDSMPFRPSWIYLRQSLKSTLSNSNHVCGRGWL